MNFSKNYKQIMKDSLGEDSIYERFKATLSAYFDKQVIDDKQKAELFTKAMADFTVSITNSAMGTALDLSYKEKELEKLELEKELLQKDKELKDAQKESIAEEKALTGAKKALLDKQVAKEDDKLNKEIELLQKDIDIKVAQKEAEEQRKALLEQQQRGFFDNRVIKAAQLVTEEVGMIQSGGNDAPQQLWDKMMEVVNQLDTLAKKHPELQG